MQHSRQHDADFRLCPVRKDSAPHQQLKPEQIKLADDIHLASSGWPQAQWWKQLNDPQLDALINGR